VTSNMGNAQAGDTVVFFGSDIIGRGDDRQLGGVLMQKFLHTLGGHRVRVKSILLMNDGVRMVGRESPVLEELRRLIAQGVEVLACGTCLERLGLTDSVGVGTVSNMYDMTDAMLKAAKVISL
jgi:selenium metabolism protein YedF